jgi:hypothetical protein
VFCHGKKTPVSNSIQDAGQAYEQTLPTEAIDAFVWLVCVAQIVTGAEAVLFDRLHPGYSRMWKGTVPDILDFQAGKVPLTSVEIAQMFALLVSLVLVKVGDVVFRSVGVTIGNPVEQGLRKVP